MTKETTKPTAAEVEELPKAIVRRVVKEKLSQSSSGGDLNIHKDALVAFSESARIFVHYLSATGCTGLRSKKRNCHSCDLDSSKQRNNGKKSLLNTKKEDYKATAQSDLRTGPWFQLLLLFALANDVCRESKRQTINAEDVFKSLEEIEFPELIRPLKASLEDFRQKNAGKKAEAAKTKEKNKKRKAEEPSDHNGNGEDDAAEDGGEEEEDEEANGDE